jgi:hypothetical protein
LPVDNAIKFSMLAMASIRCKRKDRIEVAVMITVLARTEICSHIFDRFYHVEKAVTNYMAALPASPSHARSFNNTRVR